MTDFFGTGLNERITPGFVSPSVSIFNGTGAPGRGADNIAGGAGDDTLDGGGGGDDISGEAGNDSIVAHDGQVNSTFSGGDGLDTVGFFGGAGELVTLDNLGFGQAHAQVTTPSAFEASFTLDTVETLNLTLGAGAGVVIHDLMGAGLSQINITFATHEPVGQAFDQVNFFGSPTADTHMSYTRDRGLLGESSSEGGLQVSIHNFGANDRVFLTGGSGNDQLTDNFSSQTPAAAAPLLVLNGGGGNDTLTGLNGDTLLGGAGNDRLDMNGPGDVEGGAGNDVFNINGRTSLAEDAGTTFVRPGDGQDTVLANVGPGMSTVAIDLSGSAGGPDADTDFVNLTGSVDILVGGALMTFVRDQGRLELGAPSGNLGAGDGVPLGATVTGAGANDIVNLLGTATGDLIQDRASALNGPAPLESIRIFGNTGDDTLVGRGSDQLDGGDGNDNLQVFGASGAVILGGRGSEFITLEEDGAVSGHAAIVDGGADFDTVVVQGVGAHATSFTADFPGRIVANQVENDGSAGDAAVLLNSEVVQYVDHVNGVGADRDVVIGDLTQSGVQQFSFGFGEIGESLDNTVRIAASAKNDTIVATGSTAAVTLTGLTAAGPHSQMVVNGLESHQTLDISGGDGNDSIEVNVGATIVPVIEVHGGAGNDSINSPLSTGETEIFGGDGDDLIFAANAQIVSGNGSDILLGAGGGNDVFIFNAGETGSDNLLGFLPASKVPGSDLIVLNGAVDRSFAEAVADHHIFQQGSDVIVTDGTHTIVSIGNIQLSSLSEVDFSFR